MKDYYKILKLNNHASEQEIKMQFRKLAKIHHPDKNLDSDKSDEIFKEIVIAYEVLTDHKKRNEYDIAYKDYFKKSASKSFQNEQFTNGKTSQITLKKTTYKQVLLIIMIIIAVILFIKSKSAKSSESSKIEEQLEQQPETRPNSGEINFKKQ
jgi:DnaJ-class molecular chaperone